jgi:hypothetical protein
VSILKQKLVASGIHLIAGLIVMSAFLLYCWLVAYTPPILELEGGDRITFIMLGVDVSLGPLLTFILYRQGKPGLRLDLTLVLIIQVSAFLYGGWTLCSQRPLYLAFVVEHFRIVTAGEIDTSELTDRTLAPRLPGGPRKVFVTIPRDSVGMRISMQAAAGGKDVELYPRYYRHYKDHLDEVRAHTWTLARLRSERPQVVGAIEKALGEIDRTEDQVLLAPIAGNAREATVILDRENGDILSYLDLIIW